MASNQLHLEHVFHIHFRRLGRVDAYGVKTHPFRSVIAVNGGRKISARCPEAQSRPIRRSYPRDALLRYSENTMAILRGHDKNLMVSTLHSIVAFRGESASVATPMCYLMELSLQAGLGCVDIPSALAQGKSITLSNYP